MFSAVDGGSKKSDFLDKARSAREERAFQKYKEHAVIKIQAFVRGVLMRHQLQRDVREEVDMFLKIPEDTDVEYKPTLKPAMAVYKLIRKFLFTLDQTKDQQRHEYLFKYLLASMNSDNIKNTYVSMALCKDHVIDWIHQLKGLLCRCSDYLHFLKPECPHHMKMITTCLHMLVTFTSVSGWPILKGMAGDALTPGLNQLCKNVMGHLTAQGLYSSLQDLLIKGLCRSKPLLKSSSLAAILMLALRPMQAADFSNNLVTLFLLHILAVPAVIYHVCLVANECLQQLVSQRLFSKALVLLSGPDGSNVISTLQGSYAICLIGNLVQLGTAELEGLVQSTGRFIIVVMKLLESCQAFVHQKKSNLTHWHPILGWVSQGSEPMLHDAMPYVEKQLQLLWGSQMVRLLFDDLFAYIDQLESSEDSQQTAQTTQNKSFLKKALEKAACRPHTGGLKLTSPVLTATCFSCSLYLATIRTLAQLRLNILTGLSCDGLLLSRLWRIITELGPADSSLRIFLELLASTPNDTSQPAFQLLQLASDIASHVIIILDDVEFYEQWKPFSRDKLLSISILLNQFVFKVLWNGYLDTTTAANNEVFNSVHTLLMILYERNSRRSFTQVDHWLIKDIKASSFLAELEKHKKAAQFLIKIVPHIIAHKDRVVLFRRNISHEKSALDLIDSVSSSAPSTLITVHRSRIIEDGYRQLAALPPTALKGIIRVKFINEQGLDEAGIDQDGVFKEFLEETIKRVFDPSLNLFKVTAAQKLYPSPISYIQDNHLALFEFVGKMLAKAIYEGIVVEVPFAPFFLTEILGRQNCATYSSIDELPSLDAELYKNLTYIKHCTDDVSDLGLNFSYDEDVMGKIVSHELVPGGHGIPVTNDNKISYVHLMAHFKMRVHTREQTSAFLRGFRAIVNSDWLAMFSAPELQKLISGDNADVDLEDLRRHTHYYGGFHNNHRVIVWLWSILSNDFTVKERSLFLKFVTSCSKPPLLGFANLEPAFSIRCVEVSDEQDMGDTVGSVLKGFFNIRKRDPVGRLPTSSTCFNLLKLPNYQKKATLREKLRYAITSSTGFELS